MDDIRFHEMADGRQIAFRRTDGDGPALVFLPGYMSDMDGGKATAVFEAAKQHGRPCLLLDYSGCGRSSGDFADGTLSKWRGEVLALIEAQTTAPIILAGSSMGGWLMLLVAEKLGNHLAGMIGIAAAPDFTRWGYDDDQRAALARGEILYEDNPYGPDPTPTHPGFFADAERLLRLDNADGIALDSACPIRLIHGQCDADVPWEISVKLADALKRARKQRSDDIQVSLVKDGDHRLSRDADIALLLRLVDGFY